MAVGARGAARTDSGAGAAAGNDDERASDWPSPRSTPPIGRRAAHAAGGERARPHRGRTRETNLRRGCSSGRAPAKSNQRPPCGPLRSSLARPLLGRRNSQPASQPACVRAARAAAASGARELAWRRRQVRARASWCGCCAPKRVRMGRPTPRRPLGGLTCASARKSRLPTADDCLRGAS